MNPKKVCLENSDHSQNEGNPKAPFFVKLFLCFFVRKRYHHSFRQSKLAMILYQLSNIAGFYCFVYLLAIIAILPAFFYISLNIKK